MRSIEQLTFDNTYARLPEIFRQQVRPTGLPEPFLVGFSREAAELLDLDPAEIQRPEFVEYFSGNRLLPGAEPVAMKYAGHQFGHYVPQLGDGRAILLGEVTTPHGKWDLHLKGAGQTMFSRMGDGRAVLRSSIREFLASEAMYHLGIPTTRALCVIGSRAPVYREGLESGAVVIRMAPSHVRFGSFEVFHHRRQTEQVKQLADYLIPLQFPELLNREKKYEEFFLEVVRRTAELVVHWQCVGFAHGVLNTDNMSILGLTLDYGPYGFVEEFDPGFICNHSDESGRYALDQQPQIGFWNLNCLANALSSLIPIESLRESLGEYPKVFNESLSRRMCAKLGFRQSEKDDDMFWMTFCDSLAQNKLDFTNSFRQLSEGKIPPMPSGWTEKYEARLQQEGTDPTERQAAMNRVNPKYVLRNYIAQEAIERAEMGDFREVARVLDLLRRPFEDQPEMSHYAEPAPPSKKHLVVSCSS